MQRQKKQVCADSRRRLQRSQGGCSFKHTSRQNTTWTRLSALHLLEMITGFGRWPTHYGSPKKTGRFSDATA